MKTPAYKVIAETIRRQIIEEKLPKHARLPSQNQLAAQYKVTPMTVLKAFNELTAAGIIYRKHGSGTFVAPRHSRKPILLVPPCDDSGILTYRTEFSDFFLGAIQTVNANNLDYTPEIIGLNDLDKQLPDIQLIYPQLGGIIFMRNYSRMKYLIPNILEQSIPILYCGHCDDPRLLDRISYLNQSEDRIALLTAQYLARKGYQRIGRLITVPITDAREQELQKLAGTYHLTMNPEDIWVTRTNPPQFAGIEDMATRCDAILAYVDNMAWELIKHLHKTRPNLIIPKDLAIISVNDSPIAELAQPSITTVAINNQENGARAFNMMVQEIQEHLPPHHENCNVRLIERESS